MIQIYSCCKRVVAVLVTVCCLWVVGAKGQDSVLVMSTTGKYIKVPANSPFAAPKKSQAVSTQKIGSVGKSKYQMFGAASPTLYYVRNYEPCWAGNSITTALDNAWGSGSYTTSDYSINPNLLFSATTTVVYLEGSCNNAIALNNFLSTNITLIQSWVSAGGRLFINAAPNEGGNIDLGFGNNILNFYPFSNVSWSASIASGETNHAIFNGPFNPIGNAWSGTCFAHAIISNNTATPLINGDAGAVLSELKYGSGIVLFGGMTSPYNQNPNPQAANLRANIFYYLKNVVLAPSIISFSPTVATNGNTITISGNGLTGVSAVSFGGVSATSFSVINDNTITAVVGSGATGSVSVTNSNGSANLAGFTYCNFITPSVSVSASATTICSGTSVAFTATPTNGGSSPGYQWQKNGITVGSNSTTYTDETLVNGDAITCTLTSNASCVTATTATSITITMAVTANTTPTVSISSSPSNTKVAAGGSITFTATPTNSGSTPNYQWKRNGSNVGSNSATYTDASVNNKDVISCTLTSNAACVLTTKATSNNLIERIIPTITSFSPTVSQWGSTVTITGNYFTDASAVSFGGVSAMSFTVVNATTITAVVGQGTDGVVSITTLGGTVTKAGFTYNASVANNGFTPQVFANAGGFATVGTTTISFTIGQPFNTTLSSGNILMTQGVQQTSLDVSAPVITSFTPTVGNTGKIITIIGTGFGNNVTSVSIGGVAASAYTVVNDTTITATIGSEASGSISVTNTGGTGSLAGFTFCNPVTPNVVIAASAVTICRGTSVTFSATPTSGGSSPAYQWQKNGNSVGTSSTTYTDASLVNGDVIGVVLTPNNTCQTKDTVNSNMITETVNTNLTPGVNIAASATSICSGTGVTFTATPTNGGSTPNYQWKKNGSNVGTNTFAYTDAGLVDGDIVKVILTANNTCQTATTATSNSITETVTANVSPSVSIVADATTVCTGTSVTFTATPVNGGALPSYQWKKGGVAIAAATNATYSYTPANGDVITCVLTSNVACVTATTATSNSVAITVTAPVTPSVSIATSSTIVCSGIGVTFTATPTNGGQNPSYQWKKVGVSITGATASYYSYVPADNDIITCVLNVSATCATATSPTSNSITEKVNPSVIPTVSIVASSTNICSGTSVTFTATPTDGGSSPSYQWVKNGVFVGSSNPTYTDGNLFNGDIVNCALISNAACAVSPSGADNSVATSNYITETVTANITPSVSIAALPSGTICSGTNVTFTATPTNGGSSPAYQWKKGGTAITGATTVTYAYTPTNGDVITCELTANNTCQTANTVSSNNITEAVTANATPSVSIAVTSGSQSICAGTSVSFTAAPISGGTNPSYQWKKNGSNIGSNSATYTDAGLANGDIVSCVLTANNTCQTATTATSGTVTMSIKSPTSSATNKTICFPDSYNFNGNTYSTQGTYTVHLTNAAGCDSAATLNLTVNPLPASVSGPISGPANVCAGGTYTYSVTPVSGGSGFSYSWAPPINMTIVSGQGTSTVQMLVAEATGDGYMDVSGTSNGCYSNGFAQLLISYNMPVTPSVSISTPSTTVTSGTSVTFTATPINGGSSPSYQWKKNGSNVGSGGTTYTDAGLTNGDVITCVLTADNLCQTATTVTSNGITMTVTSSITWTGTVSTDWNTAGNWNINAVPSSNSSLIIPSSAINQPALSGDVTVDAIALSGSLSINGHTLTINGAITGIGDFKGSQTSSLVIGGTVGTLLFDANNNSLGNLTITGSAILGNALNIYGVFTPSSGTFNTDGYLTLKSESITNTAVVGQVGGTVSGNVTVERFIPKGLRTFRDIGAGGVANAGDFLSNWQENGVNTNGYGIQITGAQGITVGYNPSTGFDYSFTGNHSIFTYTNNIWDSVLKTKSNPIDPYQGYRVLVRGNRTGSLQTQLPAMWSPATIRTTGSLITGTITFSVGSVSPLNGSTYGLTSGVGNCSFIANPYASVVDWEAVYNGSRGINASYWYCDPTFTVDDTGSFVGYTTFISYNAVSHSVSNPLGLSNLNRYLQPGQAFFVENETSSPSLVFSETDKAPTQSKTAIFGATVTVNRLSAGLYRNGKNVDGAVSAFGSNFSKALGAEDAIKFPNAFENMAFTIASKDVSINGYPIPTVSDEFPIHLYNLKASTAYMIRLDASQYNGMDAYLKDKTSNTQTLLVGDSTVVSFTTTVTDAASYANRYSIVFGATPLPVKNIALTATQLQGTEVAIKWTVEGESNMANYKVERSTNGTGFTDLATVGFATANNYSYIDASATEGVNYYRIKATDNTGVMSYSKVVSIQLSIDDYQLKVYPNPVSGNSFNLQLNNLESGKYIVVLIDKLGQQLMTKEITQNGSTSVQSISTNGLAAGSYVVKVTSSNGKSYQSQIEIK